MPEPAYLLNDGPLLRRLMRCPDVDGTRHTVRTLADAIGIGKSKVSAMLNGRQPKLTASQARRAAEAVGVTRKALFTPSLSAFANTDITPTPGDAR
ncbi:helix-turn-helix domain-containing protein [Streptomyces sp. NPDC051940]|uniref:helix-turn-helix domain-containing protein n=1 Tax=Streptomyces sp. NPDC051940 TaxID=3155675 RepID=UPI0034263A02